jgi:crotonobetainyl-CoA:carnitine CoA-transferase CaiB-like acyl-CoA transferase
MRPLEVLFVLDFTTLLPGPLATLLLAEAGAEVVKDRAAWERGGNARPFAQNGGPTAPTSRYSIGASVASPLT